MKGTSKGKAIEKNHDGGESMNTYFFQAQSIYPDDELEKIGNQLREQIKTGVVVFDKSVELKMIRDNASGVHTDIRALRDVHAELEPDDKKPYHEEIKNGFTGYIAGIITGAAMSAAMAAIVISIVQILR